MVKQSAVVWHSSLSNENSNDLERVQKAEIRLIMGKNINYETSLEIAELTSLKVRNIKLCLNFANKSLQNQKIKHMFPR